MCSQDNLTEDRILQAAIHVFEKKGFTGSRMQEIADRAGINKAMLHYYYRNKERLFNAVFDKLASKMFEKIFSCFDNDLSFKHKIELFYQEHISFLQENPMLPAFVLHEINQNPKRLANILNKSGFKRVQKKVMKEMDKEMNSGTLLKMEPIQLVVNVLALSIFPFAARGLLEIILNQQNIDWTHFINERKTLCPEFIINATEMK